MGVVHLLVVAWLWTSRLAEKVISVSSLCLTTFSLLRGMIFFSRFGLVSQVFMEKPVL